MQAIINSKLILPHTVLTGQTLLFGTHIYDILPAGSPLPEGTESIDAKGAYLSPGFINMHIHGCGGADTMDGTRTSMEILCRKLPKCGVTAFLPTTMTRVWPIVQKALRNVRKAMEVPCPGSRVLGAYLEGPFISGSYRGSQKAEEIQAANMERIRPYCDVIKVLVIAPETLSSMAFIHSCCKKGIIVSLGHSGATYEEASRAIKAGASHITHTFNAMSPLHHRKPGMVGAALTLPVTTEIISDGLHVHDAVLRLLVKVKGPDQIVIVTDSMRAAMEGDGISELGGQTVYVRGGRALLADGTIAASVDTMEHSLHHFLKATGLPLADVIRMATVNPAKELGVYETMGSLEKGKLADMTIFDEKFDVKMTFVGGERVYQKKG